MAVSWSRGFFRAWVVVALLWVALVTVIMSADYPTAASYAYAVKNEDGTTLTLDRILAAVDKAKAEGKTDTATRLMGYAAKNNADLRQAQSDIVQRWAWAVSVPPSVLLMLGLAIAWALRGFRSV